MPYLLEKCLFHGKRGIVRTLQGDLVIQLMVERIRGSVGEIKKTNGRMSMEASR